MKHSEGEGGELVYLWIKEQTGGKQKICTEQQNPWKHKPLHPCPLEKAQLHLALAQAMGQSPWAFLTELRELGQPRPALLRDVPPFSTRSCHTSPHSRSKLVFQHMNKPFAVPKG